MSELLPCPFCGSESIRYVIDSGDSGDWYSIVCESCGASGAIDLGKLGATEKWNTRAAVAERDAAIEKAVKDEREACAETAINCPLVKVDGKWLDRGTAIAIAIRARNETVKQ